jgi:DUF1365 family protein
MNSALYVGSVVHARFDPQHRFRKRIAMAWLWLDELPELLRSGAISRRRAGARSFHDGDYLAGAKGSTLDERVRARVAESCGRRPTGPIALLSQLRCWGMCFDPIRLYVCFDASERIDALVAEVTNTPWNEQHSYVFDARRAQHSGAPNGPLVFEVDKDFHVSPFFGMNHRYHFRFDVSARADRLRLGIENRHDATPVFHAALALERRGFARSARRRLLVRFPWMPAETLIAIYWQALRLWLRGATFHPHPHPVNEAAAEASR